MTKLLATIAIAASLGGCVTTNHPCVDYGNSGFNWSMKTCMEMKNTVAFCRELSSNYANERYTMCKGLELVINQPARPAFDVYIRN